MTTQASIEANSVDTGKRMFVMLFLLGLFLLGLSFASSMLTQSAIQYYGPVTIRSIDYLFVLLFFLGVIVMISAAGGYIGHIRKERIAIVVEPEEPTKAEYKRLEFLVLLLALTFVPTALLLGLLSEIVPFVILNLNNILIYYGNGQFLIWSGVRGYVLPVSTCIAAVASAIVLSVSLFVWTKKRS